MNEINERVVDPAQKVPLKEKLFFGAADLFGGGAQALITAVYMVFLVNVGLSVAMAGAIVMIAKLWDAVTDPLMGIISDNTRTKWGRRRPYMFAGAFLIVFSFLLLFLPYKGISVYLKFALYLFAYLFYSTVSTVIMVPYSSMSTEISTDYDEKTKVNTIRLIFSMVSSGISALVPIILVERLQKGQMTIYSFSTVMILVFGVFYFIPMLLASIKCKERAHFSEEKSVFSIKTFLKPLKVRAFVYLLIFYLAAYSCMDIISTNIVFFAEYGLKFSMSASLLLIVIMLSYAAMVPLISWMMSKGWAKPKLFRMGIPLYILGIIMLSLYKASWAEWPVFLICVLIGVGTSGCQMMPWIIFPDVVDVGELKMNDRPTGSFSGLMTFIKKSTSAIAIFITSWVLDKTGFREPVVNYSTGLVEKFDQPMSAEWGLRLVILITVVVFVTIAFIFARKLKLDPSRSRKIKDFIDLQKEGKLDEEHLTPEDWQKYQNIKKEIF